MVSKATASIDATVSYVSSGSVGAIPHHVGGGVVVNDAPTTADSTETFKVSVLGQSKGGSPLCTFSLVEFENNVSNHYRSMKYKLFFFGHFTFCIMWLVEQGLSDYRLCLELVGMSHEMIGN